MKMKMNKLRIYSMKKLALYTIVALFTFSSCGLFEVDNYDAPGETLQGEVVDVVTGERVLTDQGSEGIRVRTLELSYGDNPGYNTDIWCKPDGSFQNTKVFAGKYNVRVDGPFIPLVRDDANGVSIVDESKTVDIKGVVKLKFEVQPFLKLEWVDKPTVSNGKITAKVRVTRAVSEADFRAKIEPRGGYNDNFLYVTDVRLFVSYSSSIGYATRDDRWSTTIDYSGSAFNSLLGQTVTIQSTGEIPSGRTVYIRAAARINYDTPRGSGTRRWNYNEGLEVVVP
jgi:hypothetical protein